MIRKELAVAVILLFIGMCVVPASAIQELKDTLPVSFDGNTLYVGGTGPNNYTAIQDAIDNASNGDTVYVYKGMYYEHVYVHKSIDLIGETKNDTIIDGSHIDDVVHVVANEVYITGFTIQNSGVLYGTNGYDSGIDLRSNYNLITGNILQDNKYGVISLSHSHNRVISNKFYNNGYRGVWFESSVDDIVENNTIYESSYGVCLRKVCSNITVTRNLINNSGNIGVEIKFGNHHNIITSNEIISSGRYGIEFDESSYNTIVDNILFNNDRGILIDDSSTNNSIYRNTISQSEYGILSYQSCSDNHLYHNNFFNNQYSASDQGSNLWDNGYPSGGNYWDNYTGVDNDGDGIGDTPYYIPWGDNVDRYPLMEPYVLYDVDVEFNGGIGITVVIKNNDVEELSNIRYNITVSGGILKMIDKQVDGIIPSLPSGDEFKTRILIFGLGIISIKASVYEKYEKEGSVVLFFVIIR